MKYKIIQPPFLNFRERSRKELREYDRWYHTIIQERLALLVECVRATTRFESWEPDHSPESLDRLGYWFEGQVETRFRTQEEIDAILARSPYPIDVPAEELTDKTFSLAYDVGFYISQCFIANYQNVKWTQVFGGKSNVDYGKPALAGFGGMEFEPVRMMIVLAYGISKGTKDGGQLREIYRIWARMVQ